MNNCVTEYVKYVNNSLIQYFKILMQEKYISSLVRTFVNRYIEVRYYNCGLIKREKDFISRLSKEINTLAKELIKEDNSLEEEIKNIAALFGYVLYFDDCVPCNNIDKLINDLFNNDTIKIEYNINTKEIFSNFIKDFIEKKKKYLSLFNTNDFELTFKRMKTHIYKVDILNHCNISKLYSDYAIDKAFNTGVLAESKIHLMYVMLNNYILNQLIELNFQDRFIVDFPISVLKKNKKSIRYFNTIDNDYLKNKISLLFTYQEYIYNEKEINSIINNGFSVAIKIDDTFKNDFNSLILFNYCIVNSDSIYYDSIIENKDIISAELIIE